ncbi:MAG: tetratricopeptide repeat protein [Spartobacteria bacterium]|nr:tetratricopeptide repeat protein [Spartobacteria bacterium]
MKHVSLSVMSGLVLFLGCVLNLAGCASSKTVHPDKSYLTANNLAYTAYKKRDLIDSERRYRTMMRAAMGENRPDLVADAAYNLSLVLFEQEHYDEARNALLVSMANADQDTFDQQLLQARIALQMNKLDEAESMADQLIATTPEGQTRPLNSLLFVKIDVALARNEADIAMSLLEKITPPSDATAGTLEKAMISDRLGRIQALREEWSAAAETFDQSVSLWNGRTHPRQVLNALERSARAWEKANQKTMAFDRYVSAAQMAFGVRDTKKNAEMLDAAHTIAVQTEDDDMIATTRSLVYIFRENIHTTSP